jgi:hypothetical protein
LSAAPQAAHNDLAKEPNWLVTPTGLPALVDFQLAYVAPRGAVSFGHLARARTSGICSSTSAATARAPDRTRAAILATPAPSPASGWRRASPPTPSYAPHLRLGRPRRRGRPALLVPGALFRYRLPMAIASEHNLNTGRAAQGLSASAKPPPRDPSRGSSARLQKFHCID